MSDKREALEDAALALQSWCGERGEQLLADFRDAADEYAQAERLEEHSRTCTMASPAYREDAVLIKTNDNGERWYCYCERGAALAPRNTGNRLNI